MKPAREVFKLMDEELRQLNADRRHWDNRLEKLESELETEPTRIRISTAIKAQRIEPVGIVYLWPASEGRR